MAEGGDTSANQEPFPGKTTEVIQQPVCRYRVGHLLADLGWVDMDLESSQAGGPLL